MPLDGTVTLVRLFGGFRVQDETGRSLGAGRLPRAAREIIKILAVEESGVLDRDVLAARLWPDMGPQAARNKLYKNLHFIRASLKLSRPLVAPAAGQIALEPSARVDVREFERLARDALSEGGRIELLDQALMWYRGPLLPGDEETEWLARARQRLSDTARAVRLSAARLYVQGGNLARAIDVLSEQLDDDPCDEEGAEALISALARAGEKGRARRRYEQLAQTLRAELDVEPSSRIQALIARLDLAPSHLVDEERRPPIHHVVTSDGVRIAYWRLGTGDPLIQLPMGQMSHITMELDLPWMRTWYMELAKRFTVIRYDMRGFGSSERHGIDADCQIRDLAAVAEDQTEAVTLFATLGQGRIALQYAALAPQKVRRLILWNVAPLHGDFGNQAEAVVRGVTTDDWRMYVNAWGIAIWGWQRSEQARLWARLTIDSTDRDTLEAFRAVADVDIDDALPHVACPVLVVSHANFKGSVPAGQEYLSAIAHAASITLDGIYGPWVDLAHTQEALAIIDGWMQHGDPRALLSAHGATQGALA